MLAVEVEGMGRHQRMGGAALAEKLKDMEAIEDSQHKAVMQNEELRAALAAKDEEIERLKRESACPCCTNGTSIERHPCTECKASGFMAVAYETARIHAKLAQEQVRTLREALEVLATAVFGAGDGSEPDVYADYDKLCGLEKIVRAALAPTQARQY